jgi:putative membrane protein
MVYHADAAVGSPVSEQFKIMERRLLKAIMRPAMVVTWIFGLWLGFAGEWFAPGVYWLWLKLLAVVILSGIHGLLERHAGLFARDQRVKSGVYFRVLNEVPTLLLIVIVILVVFKPV